MSENPNKKLTLNQAADEAVEAHQKIIDITDPLQARLIEIDHDEALHIDTARETQIGRLMLRAGLDKSEHFDERRREVLQELHSIPQTDQSDK